MPPENRAKAYLQIVGEMTKSRGGTKVKPKSGGKIDFMFNPKEYTVSKAAEAPRQTNPSAGGSSTPSWTGPKPQTLSVDIFLDGTESKFDRNPARLIESVKFLMDCLSATQSSRDARYPSPPILMFGWGSTKSFWGFLTKVNVKYSMFDHAGLPLRATCGISLEEVPDSPEWTNPTSGGSAPHRSRTLVDGDTLASLAYDEYQDPARWRMLARDNGIDDPMRLVSGTRLFVPVVDPAHRN